MNETEQIELARAYVALSNSHKLDFVLPMFAENAIYTSSYVGEFTGRRAICKMMTKFFARFPNVRWEVDEFWYVGDNTIGFEFVMTATEVLTGARLDRNGIEKIEFMDEGMISRLEVNKKSVNL